MRAYVWSAIIAVLVLLLSIQLQRPQVFSSNVLDLLPATEQDEVVANAINTFIQKVGKKSLFLIGARSVEQAKQAAVVFHETLSRSQVFQHLFFRIDQSQQQNLISSYFPYRYHLLSTAQSELLRQQNGQALIEQALRQVYSPVSGASSQLLASDPLLLFPSFMTSLPRFAGDLSLDGDLLVVKDEKFHYIFIAGLSSLNGFVKEDQERLLGAFESAEKATLAQFPAAKIFTTGMVKHAHAARVQAEKEISTIGVGSIIGIIFLIGISFRSVVPLTLSLLAIGCGIISGLAVSLLIFEKLHMLTLVFGASLIGVSIDYSFHYFSDRVMSGKDWTPSAGLKRIMPGITLGLITSILGYLGLLMAPFPGLQQMAVFSSVGLIAAYATVVCWFPFLGKKSANQYHPWLLKPALLYLNYWQNLRWNRFRMFLVAMTFMVLGVGIILLKPNDDIRLLQHANPEIVAHEVAIQNLTQQARASQFLLIEGDDLQALLENEEALTEQLKTLVETKAIDGFQSISATLPSINKQTINYQLLKQQLFDNGRVEQYMVELGFSANSINSVIDEFVASRNDFLTFAEWQKTSIGEGMSHLWLGETSRGVASIILLSGVKDLNALSRLEQTTSQASLIDIAGDVSNIFERYRTIVAYLVVASYAAIFLLLCWRYSLRRAWVIIMPPVVAALASLAWFGLSGQLFNLFNVLALMIVLAIGIDYTLFFEEGEKHRPATMLAILLSALTTLLSFGLLALSATPVISAFGQTMLVGISTAFLLSPFVYSVKKSGRVSQ